MACNIAEHTRKRVVDAGRKFDTTIGETRYSTPKARSIVSSINDFLNFIGVRADSIGDNTSIVAFNEQGIRKEIANQETLGNEIDKIHEKLIKENGITKTNTQEQFQLLPDKSRKYINKKLDTLMKSLLSKMGVSVVQFEIYLADYKKRNPGKDINMVAVADLYRNIVAVSEGKRDGTTLAEEAFHFIVDVMWNTPMITDIRNLDSTGNGPDFKNTTVWVEENGKYLSIYKDTVLVEKEIIAKLLAQSLYDEFQNETLKNKVSRFLNNLLKRVLPRLARKLNLINETEQNISEKLSEILKESGINVRSEAFASGLVARVETVGEIAETHSLFSEKAARETVKLLQARANTLAQRKLGLIGETLKLRYEELIASVGATSYADAVNKLKVLQAKPNHTILDTAAINELEELLGMIKLKAEDEVNASKIIDLNKRLKILNEQISKKKFEAGIYTFFFGTTNDGVNAAVGDINKILEYILEVERDGKELDLINYGMIVESYNFYAPVIKQLNDIFESGYSFPELTVENNELLKETLSKISLTHVPRIELFLNTQSTEQLKQEFKKYASINPELALRISETELYLHQYSAFKFWLSGAQHAKEDWLGIFHKKIVDTSNIIQELTNKLYRNLFKELSEDMQSIGTSGMKKLSEKDDEGKKTGYWLNPYKIWKFNKNRDEHYNKIFDELEDFSRKQGFNYKIPRDRHERHSFFNGDNMGELSPTQRAHIGQLSNLYQKKWAIWFSKNTMPHPDAENIIKKRRAQMNITQFNLWYSKNVKTSFIFNGAEYEENTYYTGELSIPSDGNIREGYGGQEYNTVNYTNPEYNNISDKEKKVLDTLKEQFDKARQALPISYSYESSNRLPQISKTMTDVLYSGLSGVGDKITDVLIQKKDDPLFADRDLTGDIIQRPRVKFTNMLEDPNVLSDDLFRSVVLFSEMSNNYQEFMKVLPELDGMIEVAKRAKKHGSNPAKAERIFNNDTRIDESNNIVRKMEHLKRTFIQGEVVTKTNIPIIDKAAQIIGSLKRYVTGVSLLGNVTSVATGYGSAIIEAGIESKLKKHVTKEDMAFGHMEFSKDLPNIVRGIGHRIQYSKVAAMADEMGLVNDIELNSSNLEKSRALRRVGNLMNWGMWRTADMAIKYPGMIAVAKNMRLINGKLYSKYAWERSGNPMEEYDNAKSVWDIYEFNDGQLTHTLSNENINAFKSAARVLNSRLDSQPLQTDKGAIYNHYFFQLMTVNMGWLYQMIDRAFKPRHFNYLTGSTEVGWWVSIKENYFGVHGFENIGNILSMIETYKNAEPEDKEQIMRVLSMAAAMSILFAMAYVANGIALAGDDDDDPELNYVTYIITKLLLEQEARLSISDFIRYLKSPTRGIDEIEDYFRLMYAPLYLIFGNNDEVEKGIYTGYKKKEKTMIQALPLIKGWYETMYGGFINEALDKPKTSISTSISGKNSYIKNQFLNGEGEVLLGLPLSVFIKMATKQVAEPLAENFTTFSKSKNMTALPDKKSNK